MNPEFPLQSHRKGMENLLQHLNLPAVDAQGNYKKVLQSLKQILEVYNSQLVTFQIPDNPRKRPRSEFHRLWLSHFPDQFKGGGDTFLHLHGF